MNVTVLVQSWNRKRWSCAGNCAVVCCGEATLVQRRCYLLRKLDRDVAGAEAAAGTKASAGTEAVMLLVVVVLACCNLLPVKAETKVLLLL